MSGIMLDFLRVDFNEIMLGDWSRTILIKHISGETLDVSTGEKTKVETEIHVQAIVESITKKDVDLYPGIFSLSDRRAHFKVEDATIEKGDIVEIDSENYVIHDIKTTSKIYAVHLKKM